MKGVCVFGLEPSFGLTKSQGRIRAFLASLHNANGLVNATGRLVLK